MGGHPCWSRRALVCAALVAVIFGAPRPASASTWQVRAGDDLQAALDAAVPGDVLLLEAGATFTGNFVLGVKNGSDYITVRSSAADADLPPAGDRATPRFAPLFARVRSNSSLPAIRTAPGAHHWRLQFLELPANPKGYGDVLAIGDGSSAQNDLSLVPYSIVIDRVYIHGDPLLGQKRAVALNARDVTIQGCYISDIKAVGQDSQAIGGWNGPGPYVIENNYLEAAAEPFLLGGSDPAIPGLVTENVTFRRNYVSRPVSWKSPILGTPDAVTADVVTGGSLPAGAYAYRVVALRPAGQTNVARSNASLEVVATIPAAIAQGAVRITWAPVPDATEYYVYGRGVGAESMYWIVRGPSFTDGGAAGYAGAVPTSPGTTWVVKNLFELKNARHVTAEYNTFENNWEAGQSGYAIMLTPRNQDGACTWCIVEDVRFQFNVVRHTGAGIDILGYDNEHPSEQTNRVAIRHNLFYDVDKRAWGGNGFFAILGDRPRDIVIDHNTIQHNGTTIVYAYGGTEASPAAVADFQYTNNASQHGSYGIWSTYFACGYPALNAYYPGAVVQGNLIAGAAASKYPGGNFLYSDFDGQFVNTAGADFHLAASSPLRGAATDGTNVGADMDTLLAGIGAGPIAAPAPPRPSAPKNLRVIGR